MPKDKKEKKQRTKKQKAVIGIGIAFIAVFLLLIGARLAISPASPLYNSYVFTIMPKSMDIEFEGENITLYVEKNKNFNKEENQPIEAYQLYYYEDNDASKEKIFLENGSTLKGKKETSNLMILNFLGSANITDGIIRNVIKYVLIVLCIAFVVYLIYLWYLSWCIREDRKKEINKE